MIERQVHRVAGVLMLLLVVTLIVALFTAETPDIDADAFAEDFQDVADDEVRYLIGQAMQVLTGMLVAILGGALYVLYRVRGRFLPLVGFTGFVLMSTLFVASSACYIMVHALAQDLSRGDTLAGEAEVQEIGRTLVQVGDGMFFLGILFFAVGLLAFGGIMREPAPEGGVAPPKSLGWLAIAAGVCYLIGWLAVFVEIFFVFILVAFLMTIGWYLFHGLWLLRKPFG